MRTSMLRSGRCRQSAGVITAAAAAARPDRPTSSARPRQGQRDVAPHDADDRRRSYDSRTPPSSSGPWGQRDSDVSPRPSQIRRDEGAERRPYDDRTDDRPGRNDRRSAGISSSRPPTVSSSSSSSSSSRDARDDRDATTRTRQGEAEASTPSTTSVRDDASSSSGGGSSSAGGGSNGGSVSASTGFRAGRSAARVKAVDAGNIPVVRKREDQAGVQGDTSGGFFSERSFKSVGMSAEIAAALSSLGITRPSHVQAQAFQAFQGSTGPVVLADQAGSGKTLAYLLPLVQQLRQQEADAGGKRLAVPNKPRAIVLAPTVELVQQVYRVAKAVSGAGVPFRSTIMTGGQASDEERNRSWRTQKETLAGGVDLLVATPGRLLEHLQKGHVSLDACNAIVLDEVDILLGNNAAFLDQVQPLQDAAPDSMRFVLVTATLPKHVFTSLQLAFPGITSAFGPGLHCTSKGLTEELVDCSGGEDVSLESGTLRKLEALRTALRKHNGRRVIVFCNKLDACRTVENYLRRQDRQEADYRVFAYHEAVAEDRRIAYLNAFLVPDRSSSSSGSSSASTAGSGPRGGRPEPAYVLVCTDRTSRGIDSIYCDHVVLFDFPRDPSEYVRRVGRTARGAGGKGVVTALVLGRQVALAQDVMQRNERGVPVHRLPS